MQTGRQAETLASSATERLDKRRTALIHSLGERDLQSVGRAKGDFVSASCFRPALARGFFGATRRRLNFLGGWSVFVNCRRKVYGVGIRSVTDSLDYVFAADGLITE